MEEVEILLPFISNYIIYLKYFKSVYYNILLNFLFVCLKTIFHQ